MALQASFITSVFSWRHAVVVALASVALGVTHTTRAADTNIAVPGLKDCAEIGPPADRLVCYDKLAGRSTVAEPPTPAQLERPLETAQRAASLLSSYWELDAEDKRGTFNFTVHQPNYVLPVHTTSHINRSPQSPTRAPVSQPYYRSVEAKFQLSVRTKLFQDVGLTGGDVWATFTQQAMWQIWNGKDSKPFRNTDYEPELIYMVPTPMAWRNLPWDWTWRYGQLGLAHQSNGQSDPLSRSWNRVYLGAGLERGDWTFTTKLLHRVFEKPSTDDNPDLVSYRGRGEFQLGYTPGLATYSLLYRSTLKDAKYGALQFEWTYPLKRDEPNGVRWYLQLFRGYGETLTDYNFRQTSFGVGVTFLQF